MAESVGRYMLGGLIGTAVMTAILYSAPKFGMAKPDIISWLGTPGSPKPSKGNSPPWYAGLLAHSFLGVVAFPLAYRAVANRLHGPNWVRGVEYSSVLWLFANVLAYPTAGEGLFFRAHSDPPSISTVMLLGHIAYGALLGSIAEPAT